MIKKGDLVKILAGKDNGKTGKVERVLIKNGKLVVTGINMVKKHQKAKANSTRAGIIDKPMPINASNVMIICPHCSKTTRLGAKMVDNHKFRACKKCHEVIDTSTAKAEKKG